MVELAVTVDAGMRFVQATYNLEGDGPLALTCYETISVLNAAARQAYYPNLQAVTSEISSGNSLIEIDLVQHAKSFVQPGLNYYFQQLSASMKEPLAPFKAAQLFYPCKLSEISSRAALIDSLVIFQFLIPSITALKGEFPLYLAAAEDIYSSYDPLLFWKRHENDLPQWSSTARKVLQIQPSSAPFERVFSLLRNCFGERQKSSLQDYNYRSIVNAPVYQKLR